ncbi:hypothetical protein ANCCEY_03665 [Ancylostoma ceylanicum]|uniref:DUF5641 domain-containing protein n=1 Tax=Ancylostoma ceylanicum TaxID=53326 RepID=A0A0D6LYR8_9BILA|nr:hypothetical protein ANCCEY_03665 [Ancylostoma ceylanicum]
MLKSFQACWNSIHLAALAEKNATRSSRRQAGKRSPRVGDVVPIRQENVPKSMWPMSLILQLHTSKDGQLRSAHLKTGKNTILDRSVNQLVPLEVIAADVEDLQRRPTSPAPTRVQPPLAAKRSTSV